MPPATPVPLLQIDAFTDTAFGGNPAAVCWLEAERDAAWMQQVAAEMNLSETAFLTPHADGFGLRWFTPVREVDLCGHATLASAHALWQWQRLEPQRQARFHTRSGLLTAARQSGRIVLDFPARQATPMPAPAGLETALGACPIAVSGREGTAGVDLVAEFSDESAVRGLHPDFAALLRLPLRSVTATSRATGFDFVSRFFAPAMGVPEDPVTGSAHCLLATYWQARLGRARMRAFQASARGGVIELELAGDRVRLAGQAVTVLSAELWA